MLHTTSHTLHRKARAAMAMPPQDRGPQVVNLWLNTHTHTHTCTLHTMHTGKSGNGDAAAANGTSGCREFVERVCECGVG